MSTLIQESAKTTASISDESKKIGFWPLLALFYAYTTGGPVGYESIFSLSGPGVALVYLAFVPVVWSIPISLAAAELNSMLPVEGGFYRWVRAAFGDFWGFQTGWWNWTGTFLLNSAFGVLLLDYFQPYCPWMTPTVKWACASGVLCVLAYINIRGIRVTGYVAAALQVAVMIPVAWFCAAAALQWDFNPLHPWVPPDKPFGTIFGAGLALAMWNYAGYEQLSTVVGEIKNPQRSFVRAVLWTTPLEMATLVLPAGLALAALGNWSEWKTGYFVIAAQKIGGPALGYAMLAASAVATASLSNSTILSTTRMPQVMAEDGYLPKWLAGVHPKYGTPARAILISTVIYCALAATDVVRLVDIYIPLRIATSCLMLLAAWQLRRKMPEAKRTFVIPGGQIGLAAVVIVPILFCGLKLYYSDPYVLRWSPVLLASGPAAYMVLRWKAGPMKP